MLKPFIAFLGLATLPLCAQRVTLGAPVMVAPEGAREGPSWNPATGTLYTVSGANVNRYRPAEPNARVEAFRTDALGANGSIVDFEGRVIVCEAGARRVTRTEKDGSLTVLAAEFEGHKFNSPNDLTLDAQGRIYFTDPRYGNRDNMELRSSDGKLVEGVYRIDGPGKIVRVLSHEVNRPNGILLTPGGKQIYVADNNNNDPGGPRKLYRFNMKPDGSIDGTSRQVVFDWKNARGPDGLKLDRKGRLYVAGGLNKASKTETADEFKGGIYILSAPGKTGQSKLLEFVPVPKDEVTNCSFGDKDLKTLYITAGDELWKVRTNTVGRISTRR